MEIRLQKDGTGIRVGRGVMCKLLDTPMFEQQLLKQQRAAGGRCLNKLNSLNVFKHPHV